MNVSSKLGADTKTQEPNHTCQKSCNLYGIKNYCNEQQDNLLFIRSDELLNSLN